MQDGNDDEINWIREEVPLAMLWSCLNKLIGTKVTTLVVVLLI